MKAEFMQQFEDWTSKQSGMYNYGDASNCACAQFSRAVGVPYNQAIAGSQANGTIWDRPETLACGGEHTFEALHRRLKKDRELREALVSI